MRNITSCRNHTTVEILIHIIIWIFIFVSPLFFHPRSNSFTLPDYVHGLIFPLSSFIIFYINYFWLIPCFYLQDHKNTFFLLNLLFVVGAILASESILACFPDRLPFHRLKTHKPPSALVGIFFKVRNFFSLAFVAALAVFVSLSKEVHRAEYERKQSEIERKEAELKNLHNQINPHFLLNTLNNIYALTGIDTEKAQEAIIELSKMLRYMLYDNKSNEVPLEKEINFLKSYVALMRIRLPDRVQVETEYFLSSKTAVTVAPLLFISLVENAFKHGIHSTKQSFIHIHLSATEREISFSCENSNFPKLDNDKSPGGIGLQQVKKRLELAYSHHYKWEYGIKDGGNVFFSRISIFK